jgi:hypothetical protein
MMSIWNVIGTLGAIAIIAAYGLLQWRFWRPEDWAYSGANAFGAGMILISLSVEPNLPSIFIEAFWLLISLAGLLRGIRDRRRALPESEG